MDGGGDPFEVFNACQDHVLEAAQAHVDRQLLEAFTDAVDRCEDDDLIALLDTVCDLYALSTIEEHRGWYQEHGRLNAARSKAVVTAVNDLCRQLRPHALALVDAFAIPDEAIAAPIALGDEAERQAIKHPWEVAPI
jgi:acyl-CoA oxidase